MNQLLAKRPASFLRAQTQPVRDHAAAMARLTDQYVAALKRAEAQYFDGVKRITDAITQEQGEVSEPTAAPVTAAAPVENNIAATG
jgi:hypothetical protein